jgi:putative ABC transport system permease protein
MDWRAIVRTHLAEITGDAARDEDIVEELAQYVAHRVDEARTAGLSDEQALALVRRELTSTTLAATLRDADRRRSIAPSPPASGEASILRDFWQDAGYAVRLLLRNPGFTIASVVTLALGIGATAAIFSVVDAVLIRPMPYPDADRLVVLWQTDRASGTTHEPASYPDLLDFQQRSRTIDTIGAFQTFDATLHPDRGEPSRAAAIAATPEVLSLLGVQPLVGRRFTAEDDRAGAQPTVLISERLWKAAFGGQDVLGRTVRINGVSRVVVGTVPTAADMGIAQMLLASDYGGGFALRDARTRVDVWTPVQADNAGFAFRRESHQFLLIGRTRAGIDRSAAQDELAGIAAALEREYRANEERGVLVEPLRHVIVGPVRPPLMLLLAAVGLVLLLACVNVANLLLTRSTRRLREVAVRAALGAEMPRLVRQFVAENVVLTMGAGVLALALAYLGLRALTIMAPGDIPRLGDAGIDVRVLLVAFASCSAMALLFSLVPVLQAKYTPVQAVLRGEESHGATGGRGGRLLRSGLVVVEVALAVVLTSSAGLLAKSFWQLRATDPGFQTTGLLKAEYVLPPSRYPVAGQPIPVSTAIVAFNQRLEQRLRALPGVRSVAFAANHPLDGGFASSFSLPGREAEARSWPEISIRRVSPRYFETLGVPVVAGRAIGDLDAAHRRVVINQTVADRFFAGQDPVGQAMTFWGSSWSIVGVVGNERFQGVAKAPPIAVYLHLDTMASSAESIVVRTGGDPGTLAASVRGIIREMDPQLVVFGLEPLENTLAQSLGEERFLMALLGVFAALALTLAAVGIHGVLSSTVAQRRREIGIRMALGANARRVLVAVVSQGVALAGVGLMVGFAFAFAARGLLAGLLHGVTPTDVTTLLVVVGVLGAVAATSVWLPARQAARVDPLVALRPE